VHWNLTALKSAVTKSSTWPWKGAVRFWIIRERERERALLLNRLDTDGKADRVPNVRNACSDRERSLAARGRGGPGIQLRHSRASSVLLPPADMQPVLTSFASMRMQHARLDIVFSDIIVPMPDYPTMHNWDNVIHKSHKPHYPKMCSILLAKLIDRRSACSKSSFAFSSSGQHNHSK
jgi:hypothetical protein